MLKQRIITAVILTLLIFGVVFYQAESGFKIFIAPFWLIAAWEWTRISGMNNLPVRIGYCLVFFGLMLGVQLTPVFQIILLVISLFWWVLAYFFILVYPKRSSYWSTAPAMAIAGLLVLLPSWVALLQLRSHVHFIFLFLVLFLVVTAADIGAYFTGRAFGKRKLAPEVSPNKTWEGFWGGIGLSALMSMILVFILYQQNEISNLLSMALIVGGCVLTAMFSVVGDLFESMCKRKIGIKDSGKILPGHGGILDRIDSVTAAAPIYILILLILETLVL